MNKVEFTAIPWNKTEVGICESDLGLIGAKEGDWVGVKYNEKRISAKVMEVQRGSWKADKLIWIHKTQRDKLGLPDISGYDAANPSGVKLTVWKHTFTRSKQLLPAVITFILLLTGIILKALSDGGILPQFKTAFDLGLLVLAIISAGTTAYGVYTQKQ